MYVADSALGLLQRVHIQTGEVSTFAGSSATRFQFGGMWSDGQLLYITDRDSIRSISPVTAEVRTLATLSGEWLRQIWGDGDYLYVVGEGMWRVSRSTGAIDLVIDAGNGSRRGLSLQLSASGLGGNGQNLFVSTRTGLSRLDPRPAPTDVPLALLPAEGSAWRTESDSSSLTLGYGVIDGNVRGTGLVIYTNSANGTIVSETSVAASPHIREGRIYASVQGYINTGIAIANPGAVPADISFHFTDDKGRDFGAGTFTIPARQQIARFLDEAPFNTWASAGQVVFGGRSSLEGTLTFRSSVPVGAVALRGLTNERSEFLMTTLPIAPLTPNGSATAILPHYAAGGGWTTEIILVNPTDSILSGLLDFQGLTPYDIPPRSSRVFKSTDSTSIMTGAVQVVPAIGGAPSVVGIFSFRQNGVTVTSAGVPEVRAARAFEIFSEGEGDFRRAALASMGTGIAIANPAATAITVHVERFSLDGLPTGTSGILTVPARGHVAMFTHEIPKASLDPSTFLFDGLDRLRVWTDSASGISVIGLRARYNNRGDFVITSTPALPDDASNTEPAIFPHFVQGGGYNTEFVFLNGVNSPAASGRVRYFSQSGVPISLPFTGALSN